MAKKLLKWISFSVFILLFLFSFIGFIGLLFTKETPAIITMFILSFIFACAAFKISKIKIVSNQISQQKNNEIPKNTNVEVSPFVQKLINKNEILATKKELLQAKKEALKNQYKDTFDLQQIQNKGIQLLESLDIISETKSIDTLASRIGFVNSIYHDFITYKEYPQYKRYAQKAIDEYKAMYYDKIIQDYQMILLINPDTISLEKFYGNSVFNCYKRFSDQQQAQLENLKQANAITKRKENIIKVGYDAKYLFKSHDIPDYNNNLDKIEEIRKKYYSYQA